MGNYYKKYIKSGINVFYSMTLYEVWREISQTILEVSEMSLTKE